MKRIVILATTVALLLPMTSCFFRIDNNLIRRSGHFLSANGVMVQEYRELPSFDKIRIQGSLDLHFIQSDSLNGVDIEISENILPYIQSEVKDGTLSVRIQSDSISSIQYGRNTILVYGPDLSGVSIAGSGDFQCDPMTHDGSFEVAVAGSGDVRLDGLQCKELNLSIAGSGDIRAQVDVSGPVSVAIAGSGDVSLSGKAESADYAVIGSGDVDARSLEVSGSTNQSVRGSGEVRTR
ncbi:MAG: DUF2807 domain-containing protein [Bacteroidales bacterium]|nr:DUF2807 domain-containing protein [Bacteroidales bacterium]